MGRPGVFGPFWSPSPFRNLPFSDSAPLEPPKSRCHSLRASGPHEREFREQQEKTAPLGRIATPEDIALAPTFLASDDAR